MKNVNFFAKAVSIYCICLLSATVTVHSATKDMTNGKWTIRFNDETRKSEFVKDGTPFYKTYPSSLNIMLQL